MEYLQTLLMAISHSSEKHFSEKKEFCSDRRRETVFAVRLRERRDGENWISTRQGVYGPIRRRSPLQSSNPPQILAALVIAKTQFLPRRLKDTKKSQRL